MRIPPNAPPIAPPAVRRASSAGAAAKSGGAAVTEPAAPPSASPVSSPTASVATLVALAAIDDERERRRRSAEQAEAGLEILEALDAELAAGEPSEDRLREIASWSASVAAPQDPQLASILADIDLRAQIELAKHERARNN